MRRGTSHNDGGIRSLLLLTNWQSGKGLMLKRTLDPEEKEGVSKA